MLTEVHIDPNVRVAGNLTFSGFEDVRGPNIPNAGDHVFVREPEANLIGLGRVERVEPRDRIIYIEVDWKSLAPERIPTPDELIQRIRATLPPPESYPEATWRSTGDAHTAANLSAGYSNQLLLTA